MGNFNSIDWTLFVKKRKTTKYSLLSTKELSVGYGIFGALTYNPFSSKTSVHFANKSAASLKPFMKYLLISTLADIVIKPLYASMPTLAIWVMYWRRNGSVYKRGAFTFTSSSVKPVGSGNFSA